VCAVRTCAASLLRSLVGLTMPSGSGLQARHSRPASKSEIPGARKWQVPEGGEGKSTARAMHVCAGAGASHWSVSDACDTMRFEHSSMQSLHTVRAGREAMGDCGSRVNNTWKQKSRKWYNKCQFNKIVAYTIYVGALACRQV
jgi:hypothetical protein